MKDRRFVHPQEGSISPIVSEVYYHLGVSLHRLVYLDTESDAHPGWPELIATRQAAKSQAELWHYLLKRAHEAAYVETDTTWVTLTTTIPEWAAGDTNAAWATEDGSHVLYRDAAQNTCSTGGCAPWRPIWAITTWIHGDDHHIASVDTLTQARAVIAAHKAPQADAHVRMEV